jgi:hypothetical protein
MSEELVTVFRSADTGAEEQAHAVRDFLVGAGIDAQVFSGADAGVMQGVFEVRIPPGRQADAERLIEAQQNLNPEALDVSHDLDMVPAFVSDEANAEMIATEIRAILDAQGIPSVMVSGTMFPSLPYEIRVPRSSLEEARKAIAAAEEAGPAAAEEAERETEDGGGSAV